MDFIYAECEIINSSDVALARRHYLQQNNIKKMQVKLRVNHAVNYLFINETIRQQLQLQIIETKTFRMKDESLVEFPVSEPVEMHFENRRTTCRAIVLPGNSEPLLGTIPFYDMDVVIDVENHKLVVNPQYPDMAFVKLK